MTRQPLPGLLVAIRAAQQKLGQFPTEITITATNSQRVAEMVAAGEVDLGFVLATGRLVAMVATGRDLTRRLHAIWRGGSHAAEGPARDLVSRTARWP